MTDVIERRLPFDESKHKRGTGAQGGQFVSKGASTDRDSIGFDSKRGTGAGYGARGGDSRVKALQKYLNSLGFTDSAGKSLVVDGKLGPKTTSAIKRLQRKLGMKADGVVTPGLMTRLKSAAGRAKSGARKARETALTAAPNVAAKKAPAKVAKKAAPVPAPRKKPAGPARAPSQARKPRG